MVLGLMQAAGAATERSFFLPNTCSRTILRSCVLRSGGPNSIPMKFLHLNFLPRNADLALLLMRVWYGLALLSLHGWGKLSNFSGLAEKFGDPLGVGKPVSLSLAIFGEVVCAALLVMGLFTRVAALGSGITMLVAFWLVHQHRLTGPGNGELAFCYLGVFVALFIAGGGKYSVDAKIGAKG